MVEFSRIKRQSKKTLFTIMTRRMVDSSAKGVSASKAQHENATGKVKIEKKTREDQIKELK